MLALFDQAEAHSGVEPDETPANGPPRAAKREVAALAAQFDLSRRETQIGLAANTVSNYLQRIYRKTRN